MHSPRRIERNNQATPTFSTYGSFERGMALIGVMLIMSLMLMLALAVTFTALSDKAITSNFKNTTSAFYAAEAGINNLHRIIRSKSFVVSSLPNPPRVTPGQPTLSPTDFVPTAESLLNTTEHFPNGSAYKTRVKITDVTMPFPATDQNPANRNKRITYVNPAHPRIGQFETYSVSYTLESVGEGVAGVNGTVTLVEEGIINFRLLATADSGGLRTGSFAEFALYVDHFDPYRPEGPFIYQGFGPGDRFSGRVHTNERLGFWTGADGTPPPVFRGLVTQAFREASYYRHNGGQPPAPIDANSHVVNGVLVAPEFLSGFQRGVQEIPPPTSAFDQARAVLDGGFGLSAEPPSDEELRKALRAADRLTTSLDQPKDGDKSKEKTVPLPAGIYLPTDGETFTGSGIYVMGNVDDIELAADASGNRQVVKILQGKQTVTITFDIDAGTTTVDSAAGSKTLRGIPLDRSILSRGNRPAASLYVRGSVGSLHGPGRNGDNQPIPAVDSEFALTVTAGGYLSDDGKRIQRGDVTITGDLVYETPVVDAGGNGINPSAANVLGIFASGGNVELPFNRTPENLTVHASMAAFELKDSEGRPVQGTRGDFIGGRIRSDVSNWRGVGDRGNFTLVGGMQASRYDNFGVFDGRMHGFTYQGVWDPRYDAGHAPAFYPGYIVETGEPTGISEVKAFTNSPEILSYKRVYYGAAPR